MSGPLDVRAALVLVHGLVGPDHAAEYQRSPAFHHAIEVLARLLPAWVDGLAALAVQEDANTEAAVAALGRAGLGASIPRPHVPLSDLLFPPGPEPR